MFHVFQSTLPLREVTGICLSPFHHSLISIHTSPKGSDQNLFHKTCHCTKFQSTLPLREVTIWVPLGIGGDRISIHTSPKGSDDTLRGYIDSEDISIHTSPKGSDQKPCQHHPDPDHISIHTSPKGSDVSGSLYIYFALYFNPHFP